jgi:hypothetical protein
MALVLGVVVGSQELLVAPRAADVGQRPMASRKRG